MSDAELANMNARAAREQRLARTIAAHTGLSEALVRGRLKRAHGRKLLRNLFADAWPLKSSHEQSVPELRVPRATARASAVHQGARNPDGREAPRTIHRVRQEFSTSCGVAVVAMFARVSHREALSVMFPRPRSSYATWWRDIRTALTHFGVSYASRWRRYRSWEEIPGTALVKVRWRSDGCTGLHWVIFQRRADAGWRVIDPDPPRGGTLKLSASELGQFTGVTYLEVAARLP